jgi:hypothetical protein
MAGQTKHKQLMVKAEKLGLKPQPNDTPENIELLIKGHLLGDEVAKLKAENVAVKNELAESKTANADLAAELETEKAANEAVVEEMATKLEEASAVVSERPTVKVGKKMYAIIQRTNIIVGDKTYTDKQLAEDKKLCAALVKKGSGVLQVITNDSEQ